MMYCQCQKHKFWHSSGEKLCLRSTHENESSISVEDILEQRQNVWSKMFTGTMGENNYKAS